MSQAANREVDLAPLPGTTAGSFDASHRTRMLIVLTLVYTLSYVDRTIVGTIGEAIKRDLLLTDTQLGMLHGLSFAIFYVGLTIPFARIADRRNRISLISFCVIFWSVCTTLMAFAVSFVTLFLARIGVGIGEAGTSPASQSMIADAYPPQARARAIGVLLLGIPLGMLIGALVAGWVTQHYGWRTAFMVLGIPGVLLGVILKFMIKEPPRGWSENKVANDEVRPGFISVLKYVAGSPALVTVILGKTVKTTFIYCAAGFTVPFFIRNFGLDYAQIGVIYGLAVGVGYGTGAVTGALLGDYLPAKDRRWYGWLPMTALALAAPTYFLAYSQTSWEASAILLFLGSALGYTSIAPGSASFHNHLEPRSRATATSLMFVMENVLPLAVGPVLLGYLIDVFAGTAFSVTGFANFQASCPGGVAPPGSAATLVAACSESLAAGTRRSLQALSLVPLLAAFCYFLHARALSKMQRGQRAA
jgi:MFS family permease